MALSTFEIFGIFGITLCFLAVQFLLFFPFSYALFRRKTLTEIITLNLFLPLVPLILIGILLDYFHAFTHGSVTIIYILFFLISILSYHVQWKSIRTLRMSPMAKWIVLIFVLALSLRCLSLSESPLLTGDNSYYHLVLAELTQTGHIGTHLPYFFISRPHVIPAGFTYVASFPSLLLTIPPELVLNITARFFSAALIFAVFCLVIAMGGKERWALWSSVFVAFFSVTEIILLNSNAMRGTVLVLFVYCLYLLFEGRSYTNAVLLGLFSASMVYIHDYMASQALTLLGVAYVTHFIHRHITRSHTRNLSYGLTAIAVFALFLTPFLIKNLPTYLELSASTASSVYHSSEAFNALTGIPRNMLRFGLLIIPAIACIMWKKTRKDITAFLPLFGAICIFAILSLGLGVNTVLSYPILGSIWIMMAAPLIAILAARYILEFSSKKKTIYTALIVYGIFINLFVFSFCEKYWFVRYDEYHALQDAPHYVPQEPFTLFYGDARLVPLISRRDPLFAESVGHTTELDTTWLGIRNDWIYLRNNFSTRSDLLEKYHVTSVFVIGLNDTTKNLPYYLRSAVFSAIDYERYKPGMEAYYGQKAAAAPLDTLAQQIAADARWTVVYRTPHSLIATPRSGAIITDS